MNRAEALSLLDALRAAGVSVRGLSVDSRAVVPGDVFLAHPGLRADGRDYIAQAISAGAAAVIYDVVDGFVPPAASVPMLPANGLRGIAGYLADAVFEHPSAKLWVAGVTGTNGKTTVSQWLARALALRGEPCGVIGTLGSGFPDQLVEGLHTTPEAVAVHRTLAWLRDEGARAVAMEVSSIGLHQGRVAGVGFDVAIFTNLTRDHLDYHGDMQAYGEAKADLFRMDIDHAVINLDDAFGVELLKRQVAKGASVIGYTLQAQNAALAPAGRSLVAEDLCATASGVRFVACWQGKREPVSVPLVADFNVSNLLAVIGALIARGITLEGAVQACLRLRPPAGRMQMLGGIGEPLLLVDYAHTPDALEKVLVAARQTARARKGRLFCLFGCGGDRDAGKRPLMGAVAARLADVVWLTSDNPRSEDPEQILDQVALAAGENMHRMADRARAIQAAVAAATADDVLVIAGKGHEPYQEIQGVRHPFSDVEHGRAALAQWVSGHGAHT